MQASEAKETDQEDVCDEIVYKYRHTHDFTHGELPICRKCGRSPIGLGMWGDADWRRTHDGWRSPCSGPLESSEKVIHTQAVLVVSPECENFEAEFEVNDDGAKVMTQLTCNPRYETLCRQFLQNSKFLREMRQLRDLVESAPVENAIGGEMTSGEMIPVLHKGKRRIGIGDAVIWHTGESGLEPHNNYYSWFPEDKEGVVIGESLGDRSLRYLLEFEDGSRSWAHSSKVEMR